MDVDGVLLPFRARLAGTSCRAGVCAAAPPCGAGNPLLDRLEPGDGLRLRALLDGLVWAGTWMAEVSEVAPRLGLPALPFVDWRDTDEQARCVHWKTVPLMRYVAGRLFVWLDDEITDADRWWVAANHPYPALLHRIDPHRELTGADLDPEGFVRHFPLRGCRVAVLSSVSS
ncbi:MULTISPECIES: hypothetical protein [Micromonospora]|uniref:hypothetical protein n=1 Tax=Micromonospora TaxID=1873 RepID=UPI001F33E0FD|nr:MULTISPECIES: hypothetical protein [Micromonospora]